MPLKALTRSLASALMVMAVVVSTAAASTPPALAMVTLTDWFRLNTGATKEWDIVVQAGNTNVVRIKPKRLASSQPLRRIMVLYPRRSSAYDTAMSTFLNVIQDKRLNAEFTVINFLTDDVRGKSALEFAENSNFDLILSMGSESTAWLWTNYRGGKIPVVTVCSKDPVLLGQSVGYDIGSNTNFAFTSLNMPIDAQMSYVLRLRPQLKNLAILVDANNISAVQTQAEPAKEYLKARGIRVLDVAVKTPSKVKEELAVQVRDAVNTMRKNDVDLSNSLFWITGSTLLFGEIATINQHSFRVPVLSTVTDVVQEGDESAVLSVGISFESNAHQAAIYAADVLEGRRAAGALPVGVVTPPDVAISFRKAREIGMRIPFSLFESATTIFDNEGKLVRSSGITPVANTTAKPGPTNGSPPVAASDASFQ
jgi:putative ABC transport system substrate-binding protein